jgi:hypothetical protein
VFLGWISGQFFTFEEHEAPIELSLFFISICNLENVPPVDYGKVPITLLNWADTPHFVPSLPSD